MNYQKSRDAIDFVEATIKLQETPIRKELKEVLEVILLGDIVIYNQNAVRVMQSMGQNNGNQYG